MGKGVKLKEKFVFKRQRERFLWDVIREDRNETEAYLIEFLHRDKGRAIMAAKDYAKNEFIVEYKGGRVNYRLEGILEIL